MTLDEIKRAIATLSPQERAELRAWLTQSETGAPAPQPETDSGAEATASKLGRLAGRAVADIRKRLRES